MCHNTPKTAWYHQSMFTNNPKQVKTHLFFVSHGDCLFTCSIGVIRASLLPKSGCIWTFLFAFLFFSPLPLPPDFSGHQSMCTNKPKQDETHLFLVSHGDLPLHMLHWGRTSFITAQISLHLDVSVCISFFSLCPCLQIFLARPTFT